MRLHLGQLKTLVRFLATSMRLLDAPAARQPQMIAPQRPTSATDNQDHGPAAKSRSSRMGSSGHSSLSWGWLATPCCLCLSGRLREHHIAWTDSPERLCHYLRGSDHPAGN
jgi:hypothetical protein